MFYARAEVIGLYAIVSKHWEFKSMQAMYIFRKKYFKLFANYTIIICKSRIYLCIVM